MQDVLLKIRCSERGLSESLKKVNFFFLSNPVSFNGQNYQNQKGPGTSDHSFFQVTKWVQKNSFISSILPDQVDDVI